MRIKPYKAVTLFEMLLVLVMMSMISVAAYRYEYQQQQVAVADEFADKMYIFSQTVREYVRDNQHAMQAGTFVPEPEIVTPSSFRKTTKQGVTTYVFTGVSWLTDPKRYRPNSTLPYFESSFSFNNLAPLELRAETGRGWKKGDDVVMVIVIGPNIMIDYGLLYNAANVNVSAVPEGGISAAAARKASELSDPLYGVSAFKYAGGVDASGNSTAVIATMITPNSLDVFVHPQQDVTGNIIFKQGSPAGQADIQAVNNISFNNALSNADVGNVNKVTFSSNVPGGGSSPSQGGGTPQAGSTQGTSSVGGEIDNLGILNFTTNPGGGTINNIGQVNFFTGGRINNLQTLNFGGTSPNTLTGLSSVQFAGAAGASTFSGISAPQTYSLYPQDYGNAALQLLSSDTGVQANYTGFGKDTPVNLRNNIIPNTTTHFCLLSGVARNYSNSANQCQLHPYSAGDGTYHLTVSGTILCTVSCFSYRPIQQQPMMGPSCQMQNGQYVCY